MAVIYSLFYRHKYSTKLRKKSSILIKDTYVSVYAGEPSKKEADGRGLGPGHVDGRLRHHSRASITRRGGQQLYGKICSSLKCWYMMEGLRRVVPLSRLLFLSYFPALQEIRDTWLRDPFILFWALRKTIRQ